MGEFVGRVADSMDYKQYWVPAPAVSGKASNWPVRFSNPAAFAPDSDGLIAKMKYYIDLYDPSTYPGLLEWFACWVPGSCPNNFDWISAFPALTGLLGLLGLLGILDDDGNGGGNNTSPSTNSTAPSTNSTAR